MRYIGTHQFNLNLACDALMANHVRDEDVPSTTSLLASSVFLGGKGRIAGKSHNLKQSNFEVVPLGDGGQDWLNWSSLAATLVERKPSARTSKGLLI